MPTVRVISVSLERQVAPKRNLPWLQSAPAPIVTTDISWHRLPFTQDGEQQELLANRLPLPPWVVPAPVISTDISWHHRSLDFAEDKLGDGFVGINGASVRIPPGVIPTPPTPLGGGGRFVPHIPRCPEQTNRLRAHTDKVADTLNSLFRGGYIRLISNREVGIISGAFTRAGPPLATDDGTTGVVVGALFIDTTANTVYICVSNTESAAIWVQIS